jgi:lipopolysaccharide/colanic/teichoic acid biosynthesis glycosyltransferase
MAHNNGGDAYTQPNDDRITRVGRVLREYRIDELPQIINIVRGEMSWIGPRPEAVSLAEWYEREVPFYVYRHVVRPGISGWAQVHQGNVGAVDAARLKLEYDFFYIKNYSFWLDIVIVLRDPADDVTPRVALMPAKAGSVA